MFRRVLVALLLLAPVGAKATELNIFGGPQQTAAPVVFTLDPSKTTAGIGLSNGNLTATVNGTAQPWPQSLSTVGYTTGKYHYETRITLGPSTEVGVASGTHVRDGSVQLGFDNQSIILSGGNGIYYNSIQQVAASSHPGLNTSSGDLLAIEIDIGAGLYWAKDVTTGADWNGTAGANPGTGTGGVAFTPGGGTWYAATGPINILTRNYTVNFGDTAFGTACSTGFTGWNGSSANCPSPPLAPTVLGPTTTQSVSNVVITGTSHVSTDTVTVTVQSGASTIQTGNATVSGSNWSFTTQALANSTYTATAVETNSVGSSPPSNQISFSVVVGTTADTWDPAKTSPNTMSLSADRLTATNIATSPVEPQALSGSGHSSGAYHFEIQTSPTGPGSAFGIAQSTHSLSLFPGADTTSIAYIGPEGFCTSACIIQNGNPLVNVATSYTPGDLLAFEVDLTNGTFKAQDVTTSSGWYGPAPFTPGGATWYIAFAPSNASTGRYGILNAGATSFTAACSTGFVGWNGSSTPCPTVGPPPSGTGLSSPVSLLPADLPVTHWHTTVRPWSPLNIPASSYANRANSIVSWYLQNTNSDGCLNDAVANPYGGTNTDASNGATSHTVGQQLFSGISVSSANQTKGINSVSCTINQYVSSNSVGTFTYTYVAEDMTFYASAAPSKIAGWKNQLNFITPGLPGNTNNWVTYDMKGYWDLHQIGLSAYSGAVATIEGWWTNSPSPSQATRMSDLPWHLYEDQTGFPDSLSVERVGGANILGLVDAGYNGASAGAMKTDAEGAARTDLLMASADGANPAGGRQTDHNWVDSGQQLTFDIMAQRTNLSNPFLAGQYQHAAEMSFNQTAQYALPSSACCNGSLFNPTHSHNDPSLRIGFQDVTGPSDLLYNGTMMDQYMSSYRERLKSNVTEQPAPVEIGGYAFATTCGSEWCQAFLASGGIALQLATKGATAISNQQYWTAIGIDRISRVGWTGSLGPGDGYWATLGGGISFGPTWITSGTTWTRLAQNPGTCSGAFTTTFANPVLTLGRIVWTCSGVTFTQNLTVTPDGILSQTTCAGCPSTWGMTFPLMIDNGTLSPNNFGASAYTTSIGGNAAGLVQTAAANGDQQNFMVINGTPVLTNEVTQNNSYGHLSSVRAVSCAGGTLPNCTPGGTQTSFIYPRTSSDPLASAVQSGMTTTGTNTYTNSALHSSVVSGSTGTYYIGPLAAGGWANQISLPVGQISFTNNNVGTPCYFVANINGAGHVTSIETDRNVSVTVQGVGPVALTAYQPHSF